MNSKQQMFENVGKYLREKRENLSLTQTQIADILGVRSQFISNWERGMSAPPLRLMKQLMKVYKIDEQDFVEFLLHEQEEFLRLSLGLKRKRA